MAKKESTLVGMLLSLTLISAIAALSLGFTYKATLGPITKSKLEKKLAAIKEVVPLFNNNPDAEKYTVEGFDGLEFYPAKKDGILVGTAIKTFTKKGFSGEFWLMIGFLPDDTINNISVLEHKETPGLGSKMEKDSFKNQFNGKNLDNFNVKVKKDGGDVDAITASTISSRAFGDAVQRAFNGLKKGGKQ
ncbi:RnfABCDGE type electron transport complex subunit G [bacterium]|nr:RnfABCDGE type electron transport complex subunit G [bacterium]